MQLLYGPVFVYYIIIKQYNKCMYHIQQFTRGKPLGVQPSEYTELVAV